VLLESVEMSEERYEGGHSHKHTHAHRKKKKEKNRRERQLGLCIYLPLLYLLPSQ
jgi:hypothetical protein